MNPLAGISKMNLILKALIIIDAIFVIIMFFFWMRSKEGASEYWKSLYNFHLITYLLAFVEIAVKVFILMKTKN